MPLNRQSEMPVLLGLCPRPEHTQEFYVPLDKGESTRCPAEGCTAELVVFAPREAVATALVAGVEVAGKVRDANRAVRDQLADALEDLHRYSLIPDHGYAGSPCEAKVRAALEATGRSVL